MEKDMDNEEKGVIETSDTEVATSESKAKRLGNYAVETLKEMVNSLRHPKFQFAKSGIIIGVILTLISLGFLIVPVIFQEQPDFVGLIISLVICLVVAFIVIYMWFLLGIKITPIAAHYLVDNKVLKLLFTKGDVHYLEFVPEEKRKIAMPHILNK
ncbi:MAG: hypothetical protein ACXACU_16950, partial [Candidatus Hodarchaeales archaeon]